MSSHRQILGKKGEEAAEKFLIQKGYQVLQRNYRRYRGEIDLIAQDGDCLVFVEVKSGASDKFGSPIHKVDLRKQRQLGKIAMAYYQEHDLFDKDCRFDIIIVFYSGNQTTIDHIENAFWLENPT